MSPTLADKLKKQINGKSFLAYFILGALVLVFVLFGFKQYGAGNGSAAVVNHTQISIMDFQQEVQRVQQYYASLFGGSMDFGPQRKLLQKQAVENLIRQEIIAQASKDVGILATDLEVRDFIVKDIPVFQDKGIFQKDRYLRFLEYQRMTPIEFEGKVRKEMAMTRSRRLFEVAAAPSLLEVEKMKELKGHRVNVSFIKINTQDLSKKMKISDSEINQALADKAFLEKTQTEYKATKSDYDQKEEVKAQHILVAVKDPTQEARALEKVKSIQEKLKKEDFGKVAKAMSDDPGSANKNGDLGFFTKGRMVKEFDEVAFSLPVGQVSAPVKTQFGYHLIKVSDHKKAHESQFEEVKMHVAQKLLAKKKIEEAASKIEEALKAKNEPAVQAEVKNLGLSWEETGLFDLSADQLPKLNSSEANTVVFQLTAQAPLATKLIREGSDQYILKLKEEKTEAVTALDKKATELVTKQRAQESFEAWVNQYRKAAKINVNGQILAD